jgi:hypothetical protein
VATTTETTAPLTGRRPFSWWLFLLVVIFFPLFGGILYLIFWLSTSRATMFLYQEGEEVVSSGDLWLVQPQEDRKVIIYGVSVTKFRFVFPHKSPIKQASVKH